MILKSLSAMVIMLFMATTAFGNSIDLRVTGNRNAVSIEVSLTNEDTLSGMQIPLGLGLNRLGLHVDSVSFAGSRCRHFFELFHKVYAEQDRVSPCVTMLCRTRHPDACPVINSKAAIDGCPLGRREV